MGTSIGFMIGIWSPDSLHGGCDYHLTNVGCSFFSERRLG